MGLLSNRWSRFVHLSGRGGLVPLFEHLVEDEHFWIVVAWVVLVLTLVFFATAPLY